MLSISGATIGFGLHAGRATPLSLRPAQRLLAAGGAPAEQPAPLNLLSSDRFQLSRQSLLAAAPAQDTLAGQLGETSQQLATALTEPAPLSGGEVLRVSGRREAAISIVTRDGDVVEIALRSDLSLSAGTASATAGDVVVSERTLTGEREQGLQLEVNGSLDAGERKAIGKLLHRLDKAARQFFSGDLEKALHKFDELEFKGESLTAVAVSLSRQLTIDYAAALQLGAPGDPSAVGPSASATAAAQRVPIREFRRAPRPGAVPATAADNTASPSRRARVFAARAPRQPVAPAVAGQQSEAANPAASQAGTAATPSLNAPQQLDLGGALREFHTSLQFARVELGRFEPSKIVGELGRLLLAAQDRDSADAPQPEPADGAAPAAEPLTGRELIDRLLALAEAIDAAGDPDHAPESDEHSGDGDTVDDADRHQEHRDGD